MRKGYLLVEMIVVLFILASIIIIFDRFWVTFLLELPRNSRLVQESRVLNSAADCIRSDVISAKTFSITDGNSLKIETPGGVISYKFGNNQIIRRLPNTASADTVWPVPNGIIDWQVWKKDNTGYAVEISTYIEDERLGRISKKMAYSYVFFTGTAPEGVK